MSSAAVMASMGTLGTILSGCHLWELSRLSTPCLTRDSNSLPAGQYLFDGGGHLGPGQGTISVRHEFLVVGRVPMADMRNHRQPQRRGIEFLGGSGRPTRPEYLRQVQAAIASASFTGHPGNSSFNRNATAA